jgi:hypothetical protein
MYARKVQFPKVGYKNMDINAEVALMASKSNTMA